MLPFAFHMKHVVFYPHVDLIRIYSRKSHLDREALFILENIGGRLQ